jgi:Holliday junction resolvase RusA-like endonuclease
MRYFYNIDEIPPSNNIYMGRGTRKTQSQAYQAEKRKWAWLILEAVNKKGKPKEPIKKSIVTLLYSFPDKRRRDPDNYSGKFIMDGLVNAGVIEDDSFKNITLNLSANFGSKEPSTLIMIEEV